MRIAHLADTHLGYRAYNRVTRQGINRREADAFKVFRDALSKVIDIQPDLIVVAGDLFHVVRPSNLCIEHTFREFTRLRSECKAPIVLIGGNHDSPRSADTGCILDLFSNIQYTFIVHHDYQGIVIPQIDTTVFCLCHRALPALSTLKIEPNPATRRNILAVHGTIEGIKASFYDVGTPITRSQIMNDGWDYIALGHYHLYEKLDDNAYYSGSLEYTSFNIWEEAGKPKGFIEFDLDGRRLVEFHKVNPRIVEDLRPIDAEGLSAAEVNALISQRIDGIRGGCSGKILRLIVENIAKAVLPDLDYKSIREVRSAAVHFDLVLRTAKKMAGARSGGEPGAARPLEDEWREFASAYQTPPGVDRAELTALGLDYLAREVEK